MENKYIGLTIRNPYKMAEMVFEPFNPKPATWAEKRFWKLTELKNKRILIKKKIFLTLITIFLIIPIMLTLSALPSLLLDNIDQTVIFFWAICCGFIGLPMFYTTKDLLKIYD